MAGKKLRNREGNSLRVGRSEVVLDGGGRCVGAGRGERFKCARAREMASVRKFHRAVYKKTIRVNRLGGAGKESCGRDLWHGGEDDLRSRRDVTWFGSNV